MYEAHAISIQDSVNQATALKTVPELAALMFEKFFNQHPEAQEFFKPYKLEELAPRKFRLLVETLIDTLKFPDFAEGRLNEEVYRHLVHNVRDREYYFALMDALMQSIKQVLANDWNNTYEEHWQEANTGMRHMIDLAAQEYLEKAS